MVGSYVFRPDGYYICCHPYAEFAHKLTSGPGLDLAKSFIANKTKFLVMDRVGFVFWKSLDADKAFLLTNYLPMGNPAAPKTPLAKLYCLAFPSAANWGMRTIRYGRKTRRYLVDEHHDYRTGKIYNIA